MKSDEIVGILAGVLTSVSQMPQLAKMIKTKKAGDISYFMISILMVGLAGWIWYGCLKKDIPIIVTNCFALLLNITMLVFTIIYKKKET